MWGPLPLPNYGRGVRSAAGPRGGVPRLVAQFTSTTPFLLLFANLFRNRMSTETCMENPVLLQSCGRARLNLLLEMEKKNFLEPQICLEKMMLI